MAKPTRSLADIERSIAAQDAELQAAHRTLVARVGGATFAVHQESLERIAEAAQPIAIPPHFSAIRC